MSWATKTLGEIAIDADGEIRTGPFGSQLHKHDYVEAETATPVVMPKDMVEGRIDTSSIARIDDATRERLSAHILRPGDIVLGRRGEIGRRAWVGDYEGGWLCGTGSMRISIRDSQEVVPRYLYYFLELPSTVGWLQGHSVGATMSNLSAGVVQQLPVVYPSVDVQQTIIGALDTLETLIENNRRRIEILEETARLLYREWFVNFRFPGHDDIELVDSDLGPIPEGWISQPFSQAAEFVNGFAFKPTHWLEDGLPIVKIKELKNGVSAATPRYHGLDIKKKYFVDNGSVLFSWSADLDAYIWSSGPALLNQHLFDVRPRDVSLPYIYFALKDRMPEFRLRAQGTTMRHIKRSALDEVQLAVAPQQIRDAFEGRIGSMLGLRLNLEHQVQLLVQARGLLLPRLVSGELDVSGLNLELEVAGL